MKKLINIIISTKKTLRLSLRDMHIITGISIGLLTKIIDNEPCTEFKPYRAEYVLKALKTAIESRNAESSLILAEIEKELSDEEI